MNGSMMDQPLLISSILRFAERFHGSVEIVSRTVDGAVHRSSWGEVARRSRKLANALIRMGVQPGDRVGTLAWNTHRHLELYYAVSGSGAVLHTLNPRLHHDQVTWIANHAEDPLPSEELVDWAPADAGASLTGDLGWTIGNATFTDVTGVAYTKYLTVWERDRDGSWKWIADMGNGRPAPTP